MTPDAPSLEPIKEFVRQNFEGAELKVCFPAFCALLSVGMVCMVPVHLLCMCVCVCVFCVCVCVLITLSASFVGLGGAS